MWTELIRLDINAEAVCCAQKRGKDLPNVLLTTSLSGMSLLCGYFFLPLSLIVYSYSLKMVVPTNQNERCHKYVV